MSVLNDRVSKDSKLRQGTLGTFRGHISVGHLCNVVILVYYKVFHGKGTIWLTPTVPS